jgi:hypothetical protein
MKQLLTLLVVVGFVASLAAGEAVPQGRSRYVSPQGTADGSGTEQQPLALSTVLAGGGGVQPGDNVQDLYGPPVASGTFDGEPVELPMLGSSIAPDFDAFLVRTLE